MESLCIISVGKVFLSEFRYPSSQVILNINNLLVFFSFYFMCFPETVPGAVLGQLLPTTTCGVTSNPLLPCVIVKVFIALAYSTCLVLPIVVDMADLITCLSTLFPVPFIGLIQSSINGITDGEETVTGVCPFILGDWTTFVDSECPGISVDDILNIVF